MRKKYIKLAGLLLASCMAISTAMKDGTTTQAADNDAKRLQALGDANEKTLTKQIKKFQQKDAEQQDAREAYGELTDLVEESDAVEKNYAGAYIDDDNELVVNLTTSSEKIKDIVQENTES